MCSGIQSGAHQDVVLTHDLVEEGVAGAEVGGKDRVLISRAAALHLQSAQPVISSSSNGKLMSSGSPDLLKCLSEACIRAGGLPATPETPCAGFALQYNT